MSAAKTEVLKVLVTDAEKKKVDQDADAFGGSRSEYIRSKLLSTGGNEYGKERQKIVQLLCRHAKLVGKVKDADERRNLEEWEALAWQLLK